MSKPKDWSIRWKLTFMAMGTTALALLLTIASIAVFEFFTVRATMRAELEMLSEVIGGNSTAAITFNRADDATSTLATLSANPSVRAGCVYDNEGKILAKYIASSQENISFAEHPQYIGFHMTMQAMDIFHPVLLDGKSIGTVYIRADLRDLYDRFALFAWFSPLILLFAFIVAFILIGRLQRSVSVPVVKMAETSRRISEEKDYTIRTEKFGNDELGQLADAFNHMLDDIRRRDDQIQLHLAEVNSARDMLEARVNERTQDLTRANADLQGEIKQRQEAELKREQMQANLIEASRKAGMADVATGVLHNVGNVLNSINVSTQLVHDNVKSSHVATLNKAVDLMQQHASDLPQFLTVDERGKTLPAFFGKLAKALTDENSSLLKEIDGLASNIAHIREIVAMQQSFSRVTAVQTSVSLGELFEDAIKINHAGLNRHQVTIQREFDPKFMINVDRHKVLQILINLISNAKYAVNGCKEAIRQITLSTVLDGDMLRISIKDNGVGIDPEMMTRIFRFGFTTKKDGHGFGLHSSALAAKELGGTLEVHSEGLGKGASFTLSLPLKKEPAHAG